MVVKIIQAEPIGSTFVHNQNYLFWSLVVTSMRLGKIPGNGNRLWEHIPSPPIPVGRRRTARPGPESFLAFHSG